MHTLEPLCNLEQSELIRDLGMNEPTLHHFNRKGEPCISAPNGKEFIVCKSENPHDCESECLTEILKHLKEKNDASKPL